MKNFAVMMGILLCSTALCAGEVAIQSTENVQVSVQTPQKAMEDIQTSNQYVEDDYNQWLNDVAIPALEKSCRDRGIDLKNEECTASSLFYGEGFVSLNPADKNWVNARSLAYDKALVEAYKNVAEFLSLTNEQQMVSTLVNDTDKPELTENKKSNLDALYDKAIALSGAELDEKLRDLDIDPSKFNATPDSAKKEKLRDEIKKKGIKKAIADTTGMLPIQTFEGKDINGQHVIRVVVSTDPDRISLLKTVLSQQGDIMPNLNKKSSKSLRERLVLDKDILFHQFGSRLWYDEEGYPILVAFGQSGIENASSRSAQGARMRVAKEVALSNAQGNLTLLLNSNTNSKSIVQELLNHLETEELIDDKAADELRDEIKETDNYDRDLNTSTKVSGKIKNFAGAKQFHTWTWEHPQYKHKISGVVLVWTPNSAQHAKRIKAAKAASQSMTNTKPADFSEQVPSTVIRGIESDF